MLPPRRSLLWIPVVPVLLCKVCTFSCAHVVYCKYCDILQPPKTMHVVFVDFGSECVFVLWWTGDLFKVYPTSRPLTVDVGSPTRGYNKLMNGCIIRLCVVCLFYTKCFTLCILYAQVNSLTLKPEASFGDASMSLFQLCCIPSLIFSYFSDSQQSNWEYYVIMWL